MHKREQYNCTISKFFEIILSLSSTIDHSHTFTSSRGVRFTPATKRTGEDTGDPHGMPCIREVLRFLIAIINPRDK